MNITLHIISVIFSIGFLMMIFELVRRKKLKENYALTWFFVGAVVLFFSAMGDSLGVVFRALGFIQASNAILVVSIFLILVILLGLSVAVSSLSTQTQTLTQEIGLLKNKLENAEKDDAKN
jgi:hypothetical protein